MLIKNWIVLSVIFAIWQTSVFGEGQLLLILDKNSTNTIWDLWNDQSRTNTGPSRQNMSMKSALSLGEFRSGDIDFWMDDSPIELEVGAYNENGDRLWMVRFNSTGVGNNPRKLFTTWNFIDSSPVTSPSMKIMQSKSGFSVSLVCDYSSVWFQVITNDTGTFVLTTVDDLPHRITKDWEVAFKVPDGGQLPTGNATVYDVYTRTGSLKENDLTAWCNFTAGSEIYKSSAIDEMLQRNISKVKLALYKDGAARVVMLFDSFGKDKLGWLDCNNIIYSSFLDIHNYTKIFCNVPGDVSVGRHFFIHKSYGTCGIDEGWIVMKDIDCLTPCSWETRDGAPFTLYAPGTEKVTWSKYPERADALVVFVMDPTTNIRDESDHVTFRKTHVVLPYTLKINHSDWENKMFVDGVSVWTDTAINNYYLRYRIYYSKWSYCTDELTRTTMEQYVTPNQVRIFRADGNRLVMNPIPLKCVYINVFESISFNFQYNTVSLHVTVYSPKNKLMDVSYLAIHGLYELEDGIITPYSTVSESTYSTVTSSLGTASTITSTVTDSTVTFSTGTVSTISDTTIGDSTVTSSSPGIESTIVTEATSTVLYSINKTSRISNSTITESPTTNPCTCECSNTQSWSSMPPEEKQKILDQTQKIIKELQVDKKNLSSSIRQKISVRDHRPTAVSVGCFGLFMICFVLGLMIIPDALHLVGYLMSCYNNRIKK